MKEQFNFIKCKIKKGDRVKIITGDDKNKEGEVLVFNRKTGKIKVSGIHLLTHYVKKSDDNEGGMHKKEGWIDISNVKLIEEKK